MSLAIATTPEPQKCPDMPMTLWPQGAGAILGESSRSCRSAQKLSLTPMSRESLGHRRRSLETTPNAGAARDAFQGDFLSDLMNAPAAITRVQKRLESPAREDAPENPSPPPPTPESSRIWPQQPLLARRHRTPVQDQRHVSQPEAAPQPIPRRRITKKTSELNLTRQWPTTNTRRRFRCKKPDTTRAFGPVSKRVAKHRTCIRGADGRAVQIKIGNTVFPSAAGFCMARVWNFGFGGQCTRVRTVSEFCTFHTTKWHVHGRIDGPIPEAKALEFDRFATRLEMKRKHVDVTTVSALQ